MDESNCSPVTCYILTHIDLTSPVVATVLHNLDSPYFLGQSKPSNSHVGYLTEISVLTLTASKLA